jgi:TetR/AcrR family transcriptional regulator
VCAVLGVSNLTLPDQKRATEHLVALLLRGCGLN